MTLSMYQATVPVFLRVLNATSVILDKAAAHCAAKKIAPDVLPNYRLAPDMLPFKWQIFILTNQAAGCMARLAGVEVPSHPDTENTLDELKARVAKTITFIHGFKQEQIDGTEKKDIVVKYGTNEYKFVGEPYVQFNVIPNIYFHCTTAYAILRHCGVEIGKGDFLGS